MHSLTRWLLSLLGCIACVVASYLWLDKPLSYFAHEHLQQFQIFSLFSGFPKIVGWLAIAGLVFSVVCILTKRPPSKIHSVAPLCGLSLLISDEAENWLKYAFGRTWPETWIENNPSLIGDGIHGFNFFHGGRGYAAFPSGHMTAICAVMSVLWMTYPRYRALYVACVALSALGQIGANYHFLGDVIAGVLLGWSVGWVSAAVWEAPKHPLVGAKEPATNRDHKNFG